MKAKTIDWLNFAESDITAAKILIEHSSVPQVVAFHCEQAVEKVLKAILEENGAEVPKIHRMIVLFEMVKDWYQPNINLRIILSLDKLYINARYPGDFGLLPDGDPSKEEIKEFFLAASDIYNQVKELLR